MSDSERKPLLADNGTANYSEIGKETGGYLLNKSLD